DPNTLWLHAIDGSMAFMFQADNVRISGFVFRGWTRCGVVRRGADTFTFDRNICEGFFEAVYFHNNVGDAYGVDNVIQNNRFVDRNLRAGWNEPSQNNQIVPWKFIKASITNANGTGYSTS